MTPKHGYRLSTEVGQTVPIVPFFILKHNKQLTTEHNTNYTDIKYILGAVLNRYLGYNTYMQLFKCCVHEMAPKNAVCGDGMGAM